MIYSRGDALLGANLSLSYNLDVAIIHNTCNMDAGSCSSQFSAHEQQMSVARKWQKSHCWGIKNVDCGAGTGTDQSKSNPCAPLFQSPAGNADGLTCSILLSLFLLKALLTLRGPHVY